MFLDTAGQASPVRPNGLQEDTDGDWHGVFMKDGVGLECSFCVQVRPARLEPPTGTERGSTWAFLSTCSYAGQKRGRRGTGGHQTPAQPGRLGITKGVSVLGYVNPKVIAEIFK